MSSTAHLFLTSFITLIPLFPLSSPTYFPLSSFYFNHHFILSFLLFCTILCHGLSLLLSQNLFLVFHQFLFLFIYFLLTPFSLSCPCFLSFVFSFSHSNLLQTRVPSLPLSLFYSSFFINCNVVFTLFSFSLQKKTIFHYVSLNIFCSICYPLFLFFHLSV